MVGSSLVPERTSWQQENIFRETDECTAAAHGNYFLHTITDKPVKELHGRRRTNRRSAETQLLTVVLRHINGKLLDDRIKNGRMLRIIASAIT